MFTTIFVGAAAAAARSASSRHSVAWCTSARRSGRSGQRAALTFVAARSAWARARAAPGSFGFRPRSLRPLAASSAARLEPRGLCGSGRGLFGLDLRQRRLQAGEAVSPAPQRLVDERVEELCSGLLGGIGLRGLGEDLVDLGADPCAVAVLVERGVRADLRAVDRDLAERGEPGAVTELHHLDEDRLDRRLVLCPEAGDRREVGDEVHADHPEGEVRAARRLDRPRGAHARRVGVEQGGEHHLRVVGRPSCTLGRVLIVERGGVEEADRVDQEVGEVALLEPVEHARREEEQLLTVTTHIPICHDEIVVDNVN